jgi:hypothetical protein
MHFTTFLPALVALITLAQALPVIQDDLQDTAKRQMVRPNPTDYHNSALLTLCSCPGLLPHHHLPNPQTPPPTNLHPRRRHQHRRRRRSYPRRRRRQHSRNEGQRYNNRNKGRRQYWWRHHSRWEQRHWEGVQEQRNHHSRDWNKGHRRRDEARIFRPGSRPAIRRRGGGCEEGQRNDYHHWQHRQGRGGQGRQRNHSRDGKEIRRGSSRRRESRH